MSAFYSFKFYSHYTKSMKIRITTLTENPEKPEYFTNQNAFPKIDFDTEWFVKTTPSINNTDLFVPEWEDSTDMDTVVLFFLAEYSKDLIENNEQILCREAINALTLYNLEFEPKTTEIKIQEDDDSINIPF